MCLMNSRENHDQLTLQQIQMFQLSICFAENCQSVKMHISNWLKLIIFFILAMESGFTDLNLMTKFCSEKHIDRVYSSWDGIHVIRGQEKWIFHSESFIPKHYDQQGHANEDGHEIESMVYIDSESICEGLDLHSEKQQEICDHVKKADHLLVGFYLDKENHREYYKSFRVNYSDTEVQVENIEFKVEMPFQMEPEGDVKVKEKFWPNEWFKYTKLLRPILYDAKENTIFLIVNYEKYKNPVLKWYSIIQQSNFTKEIHLNFKVLQNSYWYIGIMHYNNEIYLIGNPKNDSKYSMVYHWSHDNKRYKKMV